jgi:hypothetical protein
MADFLLVFQNGDPNWRTNRTPEQIRAGMEAWGRWFKRLEASGNLRNPGAPLAPGGTILSRNGGGIQTDMVTSEVQQLIGGYSIIAADTLEQASELAKEAPFLANNPEGRVVVRQIEPLG